MQIMLKNVRLSFPDLWTPRVQGTDGEGEPKFAANFIVEPANPCVKELDKAIASVAEAKWPGKSAVMLPKLVSESRVCLHRTSRTRMTGEVYDGYEGMFWLGANSKRRPVVIDRDKAPLVEADGRPYSGCIVNAMVDIYAHTHPKGGNRVLAQLMVVQFAKDGDAFGGAPPSTDAFETITDDDDLAA